MVAIYPCAARFTPIGPVWDAWGMPWVPELFSEPALGRLLEQRERAQLEAVPYFDGLMAGEPAALVGSFAGEPALYDPVRGRVQGVRAFEAFAAEQAEWLRRHNATTEMLERVVTGTRGFEEVVLHLDGEDGPVALPLAIVADRLEHGRLDELRIYFSRWRLTGRHASRSPLLQADPGVRIPDVVGEYQRALAAGDVDAIVATFAPDGYAREPAGGDFVHRGPDAFAPSTRISAPTAAASPLEHCALTDDGRSCALEYNVVRWGDDRAAAPGRDRRLRPRARAASSPRPASMTTSTRRSGLSLPRPDRRRRAGSRR